MRRHWELPLSLCPQLQLPVTPAKLHPGSLRFPLQQRPRQYKSFWGKQLERGGNMKYRRCRRGGAGSAARGKTAKITAHSSVAPAKIGALWEGGPWRAVQRTAPGTVRHARPARRAHGAGKASVTSNGQWGSFGYYAAACSWPPTRSSTCAALSLQRPAGSPSSSSGQRVLRRTLQPRKTGRGRYPVVQPWRYAAGPLAAAALGRHAWRGRPRCG